RAQLLPSHSSAPSEFSENPLLSIFSPRPLRLCARLREIARDDARFPSRIKKIVHCALCIVNYS
ncbi:MAG: hypothetical protein K2I89_01350, partial [Muribaculaceae bacterium]|nr:hypothetical protein [Muribaculaceae bacterium]